MKEFCKEADHIWRCTKAGMYVSYFKCVKCEKEKRESG
jgi:hypothetical protein